MSRAIENIAFSLVLLAWSVATQPIRYSSADSSPPPNAQALAWVNATCPITAGHAPNCDGSTTPPALNILDFLCFLDRFCFRAYCQPSVPVRNEWADCDDSGAVDVVDFACFVNAFARGETYVPPLSVLSGLVTFEHGTQRGAALGSPAFDSTAPSRQTVQVMADGPVVITCTAEYLDIVETWHVTPAQPGDPDVLYLARRLRR